MVRKWREQSPFQNTTAAVLDEALLSLSVFDLEDECSSFSADSDNE